MLNGVAEGGVEGWNVSNNEDQTIAEKEIETKLLRCQNHNARSTSVTNSLFNKASHSPAWRVGKLRRLT